MYAIIEVDDIKKLNTKDIKIINTINSLEDLKDFLLIEEAKKENLENIKYEEVLKQYGIDFKQESN